MAVCSPRGDWCNGPAMLRCGCSESACWTSPGCTALALDLGVGHGHRRPGVMRHGRVAIEQPLQRAARLRRRGLVFLRLEAFYQPGMQALIHVLERGDVRRSLGDDRIQHDGDLGFLERHFYARWVA